MQELQNTAWVDVWVWNYLRDHYSVCEGRFSFLFWKQHCRKCGEIICYNCSVLKHLQDCNTSESVRMCTPCLSGLRSSNWAVLGGWKIVQSTQYESNSHTESCTAFAANGLILSRKTKFRDLQHCGRIYGGPGIKNASVKSTTDLYRPISWIKYCVK